MGTNDRNAAIEALAESWASIDGRLEAFRACKADAARDEVEGRYVGYMADAHAMLECLERRGFTIGLMEVDP